MTEKSNQALQEEIEFLQGHIECLTGITALQLSIYFVLLKKAANGKLPLSQINTDFQRHALENSLKTSFEGKSQHFINGFTEARNHCLELCNHWSSSELEEAFGGNS